MAKILTLDNAGTKFLSTYHIKMYTGEVLVPTGHQKYQNKIPTYFFEQSLLNQAKYGALLTDRHLELYNMYKDYFRVIL